MKIKFAMLHIVLASIVFLWCGCEITPEPVEETKTVEIKPEETTTVTVEVASTDVPGEVVTLAISPGTFEEAITVTVTAAKVADIPEDEQPPEEETYAGSFEIEIESDTIFNKDITITFPLDQKLPPGYLMKVYRGAAILMPNSSAAVDATGLTATATLNSEDLTDAFSTQVSAAPARAAQEYTRPPTTISIRPVYLTRCAGPGP